MVYLRRLIWGICHNLGLDGKYYHGNPLWIQTSLSVSGFMSTHIQHLQTFLAYDSPNFTFFSKKRLAVKVYMCFMDIKVTL